MAIDSYEKEKASQLLQYMFRVWEDKVRKFGDKIWNIPLHEEVVFFISIYNRLMLENDSDDLLLITLIRIDYLLAKGA